MRLPFQQVELSLGAAASEGYCGYILQVEFGGLQCYITYFCLNCFLNCWVLRPTIEMRLCIALGPYKLRPGLRIRVVTQRVGITQAQSRVRILIVVARVDFFQKGI